MDDIELSTREAGSSVWRRQALPDSLPKFEMTELRPTLPSSPPPGRPGRGLGFAIGGVNREVEEVAAETINSKDNVADRAADQN